MRKFFALVLVSYLTAFSAPFVVIADDHEDSNGYNSDAERCYYMSADCEDVTQAQLDAIEANDGVDPDAQQDFESDCDYNGSNCPDLGGESTAASPEEMENAIDHPKMCPFDDTASMTFKYGEKPAAERDEAYEWTYQVANGKLEASFSADNCGEPNSYSKYLEKGDCSEAGKIITEITEVIAPDVVLEDNKIITVYAGLCCVAGETSDGTPTGDVLTCDDTRTIYATTYDGCDSVAVNCDKRQWVIGSSGIGVVKLMVKQIFTFGALSVGSIAVGTMIFQGIKISVSGVSGDISESKTKILQALSGIVLLFLSGLILYTINPGFFG